MNTTAQAKLKGRNDETLPSPTLIVFGVMLFVTFLGLGFFAKALSDPAALPIRKVMVEGEFKYLEPDRLQAVVVEAVDAGFFGVDVTEIQDILLDEPWIRDATVRRVWPDALRVSIEEQLPVARWGSQALLNDQADIFVPAPDEIPEGLARLSGPVGTESTVLKRYFYVRRQLGTVDLWPQQVDLSERDAWTVTLSTDRLLILGRKEFEIRLARFVFGYKHGLDGLWERIGRVDLRYTNGFAVAEDGSPGGSG
jgi:cell division protein FtsQ